MARPCAAGPPHVLAACIPQYERYERYERYVRYERYERYAELFGARSLAVAGPRSSARGRFCDGGKCKPRTGPQTAADQSRKGLRRKGQSNV